jgi:hypothetical protein
MPGGLFEVRDSCATASRRRSSRSRACSSTQGSRRRPSLDIGFQPHGCRTELRDRLREVRPRRQAEHMTRGLAEELPDLGEPEQLGETLARHCVYDMGISEKCPGAAATARGVATGDKS